MRETIHSDTQCRAAHEARPREAAFLSFFLAPPPVNAAKREKTDVIYMKSGDRITGEIKKLADGHLEVKAAYGKGSFILNWAEIEKIDSPQYFVVEAQTGTYFEGLIHTVQSRMTTSK